MSKNPSGELSDAKRLEDETFVIKGYRIDTNVESKEMRIVFFGDSGQKRVLGHLTLDSNESYEYAHLLLKNYDRLEGIK